MVGQQGTGDHSPTKGKAGRRTERGWERVTAENREGSQARSTFRIDAPSPSEEVLAKHDADLVGEPEASDQSTVTCF